MTCGFPALLLEEMTNNFHTGKNMLYNTDLGLGQSLWKSVSIGTSKVHVTTVMKENKMKGIRSTAL
jgi:hypothetical protein